MATNMTTKVKKPGRKSKKKTAKAKASKASFRRGAKKGKDKGKRLSDGSSTTVPSGPALSDAASSAGDMAPLEDEPRDFMWNGFNLSAMGLPADVRPSGGSGKQSFTVYLQDGDWSVDVLLKKKAYFVKAPKPMRGTFAWSKYGGAAEAWNAIKRKAGVL